jgi:hypothetical protein
MARGIRCMKMSMHSGENFETIVSQRNIRRGKERTWALFLVLCVENTPLATSVFNKTHCVNSPLGVASTSNSPGASI